MNLIQLRTKFRTLSGRFDLVNDDMSDNGADFFISAGQKYLDRLETIKNSYASCFRILSTNHFSVTFPYCRAVKDVWLGTTDKRWKADKLSLNDIIGNYLSGGPSSRTSGLPSYYALCTLRHIPEDASVSDIESFVEYVDTPAGNTQEYNAIIFSAPAQEQLSVTISGLFYSKELVSDTDTNYWSVTNPLLLLMAAMRAVEITNRNTQGVNDWTNSINSEIHQLGYDGVEEMIADVDQMEG